MVCQKIRQARIKAQIKPKKPLKKDFRLYIYTTILFYVKYSAISQKCGKI
jgi:hypothetical protein